MFNWLLFWLYASNRTTLTRTSRVNHGKWRVFRWSPESFRSASVESWHFLWELQSWATWDFAHLELTSWTPIFTLLYSSDRIVQFRTEFGQYVNLKRAGGGVSSLIICNIGDLVSSPQQGLSRTMIILLRNFHDGNIVAELWLVPSYDGWPIFGDHPEISRAVVNLRRDLRNRQKILEHEHIHYTS